MVLALETLASAGAGYLINISSKKYSFFSADPKDIHASISHDFNKFLAVCSLGTRRKRGKMKKTNRRTHIPL